MSLRINTNIEAFNAHRQLEEHAGQLQQVHGEAVVRPAHQPRRRRRRRPRHLREDARPDQRHRPGPAERDGRHLAGADRRRRAQRGARDPAARPRARRPVQQRHAVDAPTRPRSPSRSRQLSAEVARIVGEHPVQRHRPALRRGTVHLPGRREPAPARPISFSPTSGSYFDSAAPHGANADLGRRRGDHERLERPLHLRRRSRTASSTPSTTSASTRRTSPPPRAASATSTSPPRWSTSRSSRSSPSPAPPCSPRRTSCPRAS